MTVIAEIKNKTEEYYIGVFEVTEQGIVDTGKRITRESTEIISEYRAVMLVKVINDGTLERTLERLEIVCSPIKKLAFCGVANKRPHITAPLAEQPDIGAMLEKCIGVIRQRMGFYKKKTFLETATAHQTGMMKAFGICEKILREAIAQAMKGQ
jgi:hypothetical protein